MLDTSLSLKSSWKNSSPLFTGCYSFFSSTCLDEKTCSVRSPTTSCCNSSFSTSLDARNGSSYSSTIGWGIISTSSFESEITMTCGAGVVVKVMVFLRKLRVASNSFSNSPLISFCSKTQISFVVGVCEVSDST